MRRCSQVRPVSEIRAYFPAWRIFIFGVDVTEDVTRCIINYTGSKSRAPSVCEIELVNGGTNGRRDINSARTQYLTDRYTMTKPDIATLYGTESDLPQIQFPDVKDVLQDIVNEGRTEFGGRPPNTIPEQEIRDVLGVPTGPLSPAEQEEGVRRLTRLNRARERTAALTSDIIQTRVAQRQSDLDSLVRERIKATITDPLKLRVLNRKFNVRQQLTDRAGNPLQPNLVDSYDTTSIASLPQLNGQALRYPFQTGDCIFHSNDPIRIFWRDPTTTDRWYHMFAGFVSDTVDAVDQDNQRIIRIRAEDPTRLLRYARITTNPGILDIDDIAVQTDAVTRTFFSDGFPDLTLPEFLFTLLFGADKAKTSRQTGTQDLEGVVTFNNLRVGVNGESSTELASDAIGAFNFERSFVAIFGPEGAEDEAKNERDSLFGVVPTTTVDNLGQYQALVDHQVYISDLDNMSLTDAATQQKVEQLKGSIRKRPDGTFVNSDIVEVIGEHPELFPVDYGRLCFLVPGSLGPGTNRDLLLKDITGVNVQTTWRNRLSLIYDVIERVDFSFYASPKGDILCEMPLYDFEPDDFGDGTIDLGEFLSTSRGNVVYDVTTDRERGPYAPHYRVAKRDTQSWERSFIDENVRTQMIGIYSLIAGFEGLGTSRDVGQVSPVNLYGLMPQFGIRSEFIEPRGIISNENAARVYANVKLNQINSQARQADVEILPRVQLGFPNRPIEFVERTFVATTESITHNLVWGLQGDMTTDMNVHYVRAWGGQESADGRPVYEPIGGFASQGLNYALRFGLRDPNIRNTREN